MVFSPAQSSLFFDISKRICRIDDSDNLICINIDINIGIACDINIDLIRGEKYEKLT